MIFMQFTEYQFSDSDYFGESKIWIQLDHIVSVKECQCQADRTLIELSSGTTHEVTGYANDILKEIVSEYRGKTGLTTT